MLWAREMWNPQWRALKSRQIGTLIIMTQSFNKNQMPKICGLNSNKISRTYLTPCIMTQSFSKKQLPKTCGLNSNKVSRTYSTPAIPMRHKVHRTTSIEIPYGMNVIYMLRMHNTSNNIFFCSSEAANCAIMLRVDTQFCSKLC